ncbi:hypothetical protein MAR_023797 [Mya arenaria]|uniref:PID domain-containing protein n=1 Tax=Mya arenaria TaxID=6604 RepID=A0ABY7DS57_MYAAR|nr:hypothetical protein MAR_023797 [Mya arenaria]
MEPKQEMFLGPWLSSKGKTPGFLCRAFSVCIWVEFFNPNNFAKANSHKLCSLYLFCDGVEQHDCDHRSGHHHEQFCVQPINIHKLPVFRHTQVVDRYNNVSVMSGEGVSSVCPICSSPDLVHLCSAYLDAKANMAQHKVKPANLDIKRGSFSKPTCLNPVSEETDGDQHGCEKKKEKSNADANGCDNIPKFVVIYLGSSHLDRRFHPQTAMPWVMAEVKRSRDTFKEVQLQIHTGVLKAMAYDGTETIETVFEHNLHSLSRFAKTHQDPRCFAYLQRHSLYSDFECHVFLANDETVSLEADKRESIGASREDALLHSEDDQEIFMVEHNSGVTKPLFTLNNISLLNRKY